MIQANQLRTGNVLFDTQINEAVTINAYDISRFENPKKKEWAGRFTGLPVTPEVLIACGFEKGIYEDTEQWLGPKIYKEPNKTYFRIGILADKFFGGYIYQNNILIVRTDDLHTLQNLHFFLSSGHELIYKPE